MCVVVLVIDASLSAECVCVCYKELMIVVVGEGYDGVCVLVIVGNLEELREL